MYDFWWKNSMLLVDDFQPTCPLKESSFGSLHKVSAEIPYIHARFTFGSLHEISMNILLN